MTYQVLLYYKYVQIEDPEHFAMEHLALCKRLGLKGRIIVASEGINGTLSGPIEATESYREHMNADARFADMEYKIDPSEGHVFRKIFVRAKAELVTLRYEKHLDPADFQKAIESGNAIILDGRTDYEYDLGHFEGAIRPNVQSFREFPQWIRENMLDFRDKPILTYCTGGIRCEKLSALMLEEGFKDVAQLKGGIVSYGKDPVARGAHFKGKCYVFDERIGVPINQVDPEVVSRCKHCDTPSDRYVNCSNLGCHSQFFCCEACVEPTRGFCSDECSKGRTLEMLHAETLARSGKSG